MTRATIDKYSRLQGYPKGVISPEVAELQRIINSYAQYDSRISRALNVAINHMIEQMGRDPDWFNFYEEELEFFLNDEGNDEFQHYMTLINSWEEYAEMAENGEIEPVEPYRQILNNHERLRKLDL